MPRSNFSVANGLGSGRSDLFQAGAFIRHTAGPASISGARWLMAGRTSPPIAPSPSSALNNLHAQFNANTWSGRVEGGYRFVSPWMEMGMTPYVAGQVTTFDLPAYAEQVVGGTNLCADLQFEERHGLAQRTRLAERQVIRDAGRHLHVARTRGVGARLQFKDRFIGATFQTLPGASFVVNGAAQAHDAALSPPPPK